MTRALVLIDGEHYPAVVRDAIAELPFDIAAAVIVGGTEKLRGGEEDYGVPLLRDLDEALAEHEPELVYDLSDEPVLGPKERLRLASRVLARGVRYEGGDFAFRPPELQEFPLPSLAVIGMGKRVGKTAVTGHIARLLARDRDVVVVSMGRGGPREPEVVETPPTVEALLERSRAGSHAASDFLETAAVARVPTIGCRRAGGGLAGATTSSNVLEGAKLALEREPDVVVFDASGASLPPIATDKRILVTSPKHELSAGLNAYRVLVSDLVIVVRGRDEHVREIRGVKDVPVVPVELRLRAVEDVSGRRAAVFTTGADATDHLDADVVALSKNLSNREELRKDLERAHGADVYLVEVKAAAIDVVAEAAAHEGIDVVLLENEVVGDELDEHVLDLLAAAVA